MINVKVGEGRLLPMPGGKTHRPGEPAFAADRHDPLIFRMLEHGDLVRADDDADAVDQPGQAEPPAADTSQATAALRRAVSVSRAKSDANAVADAGTADLPAGATTTKEA